MHFGYLVCRDGHFMEETTVDDDDFPGPGSRLGMHGSDRQKECANGKEKANGCHGCGILIGHGKDRDFSPKDKMRTAICAAEA